MQYTKSETMGVTNYSHMIFIHIKREWEMLFLTLKKTCKQLVPHGCVPISVSDKQEGICNHSCQIPVFEIWPSTVSPLLLLNINTDWVKDRTRLPEYTRNPKCHAKIVSLFYHAREFWSHIPLKWRSFVWICFILGNLAWPKTISSGNSTKKLCETKVAACMMLRRRILRDCNNH